MAIRKPRLDVVRRRLTRVVEAALKPMHEGSSAACPERSVKPYRMIHVLAQAACKTLAGLAAGSVASYLHALGLALFPLVEDAVGRYSPPAQAGSGRFGPRMVQGLSLFAERSVLYISETEEYCGAERWLSG